MRTSFIVNDTLYLANVSYILLGFSNLYISGQALHALILNPHALHLVPRLINIVRGVVPNPSLDPSLYLTTFFTKTLKNLGIHILPRISLCVLRTIKTLTFSTERSRTQIDRSFRSSLNFPCWMGTTQNPSWTSRRQPSCTAVGLIFLYCGLTEINASTSIEGGTNSLLCRGFALKV